MGKLKTSQLTASFNFYGIFFFKLKWINVNNMNTKLGILYLYIGTGLRRRYQRWYTRCISGIIFIRYTQNERFQRQSNGVCVANITTGPKQDWQNTMKALALSLILLSFVYTLPHGSKYKKSTRTGTQFTTMGMLMICWKNVPSKLDKNVINKELQHPDDFIFCVAHIPVVLCLTTWVQSWPTTINL
jgi:hypothetical protein